MSDCPTLKPSKRLIKEAIRDLLKNKTEARDRVAISQSIPTDEEEVPKILIYSVSEEVSRFNQSPKNYKRVPTITIEIITRGDNDNQMDEELESIGEKVETLLETDETLNDLIDKLELKSSSYATSFEGSLPLGSLALSYDITFYENAIRKGSICYPPLEVANVEWEVGPEKETTASDQYNFEQGET